MSNIELSFETPWLLLLLIPALAIIFVPFFLLPKKRRNTVKKILPVILHAIIVILLVLILSGFSIVKKSDDQAVLLLVDLSDSTKDVQSEIVEHTEELLNLIDADTPVGVILFGSGHLYAAKLEENTREFSVKQIMADSTDIDSALEFAATQLPSGRAGHIIVLSDGRETDGNAAGTAHYLATKGIRIDAVYFDSTDSSSPEIQISEFISPEGAYTGDSISFSVELMSNTSESAALRLYDNEELVLAQTVEVTEGSTVVSLQTTATGSGIHTYRLEMVGEYDTINKNNTSYAYLKITGEPSILIISDTVAHGSKLENLLKENYNVTVATAQKPPKNILELCNYDEIILSNVNYEDLPSGYASLLDTYVGVYGRSLLVSGGNETMMYGGMGGTKLEEMLPVTLSLSKSNDGNAVALMLVLDCSMSMSNTSTYLSVAKQGAIKCVEALNDCDYVGVVSFNRSAYLKQELIKATDGNKQSVTRIISGLTTSQGTYYTQAIQLAYEQLKQSDAAVKHIIFLSDGQPSDSGYTTVAANAAADGITISTIGLGYSSSILQTLADKAGGRYYYVSRASDLPNIMLSETEQVTVSSMITGDFIPFVSESGELTEFLGTVEIPMLHGYLGTTIKEDAKAYIVATEDENPIYAEWEYGTGTVGCFTSDMYGEWSNEWFASEIGVKLLTNMIETTVDDIHHDSSLSADITVRGKTTDIKVVTNEEIADNTIAVNVSYGTDSKNYILTETSIGVYEVSVPSEETGIYQVMILESDSTDTVVDYLETAFAVSYSAEYNAFSDSGKGLLEEICSYSDGQLFTDMQELSKVSVVEIDLIHNPLVLFAILSLILMLADIAIRKIRWKDIKAYWLKYKNSRKAARVR